LKRSALVAVSLVALLLCVLAVAPVSVAASIDPTVNLTVIGSDGQPLENVDVTLYDESGNTYDGTTDENGTVSIEVPRNATYLVLVDSEYYILDTVTVAGDTNATVDASGMYSATIKSIPKSVDVTLLLLAFEDLELTMTANFTVYAPSDLNVTFPLEIEEFPYKYVFDYVKYDTVESEDNTITLDMNEDYVVTAYYAKTFYMALEYWLLIALVVVIIIALAVAWSAGAKTARAMINEWRNKNRKFVHKK